MEHRAGPGDELPQREPPDTPDAPHGPWDGSDGFAAGCGGGGFLCLVVMWLVLWEAGNGVLVVGAIASGLAILAALRARKYYVAAGIVTAMLVSVLVFGACMDLYGSTGPTNQAPPPATSSGGEGTGGIVSRGSQ